MLRFPLLAAAALLLPNVGAKPADLAERPASVARVTSTLLPGIRIPKFLRHRTRGVQLEMQEVKIRLRDLVVQEEAWYAQNNSYTRNVSRAATLAPGDSATAKVQVQILFASSKGWSAVASHPNAPGRSCVAYVGQPESIPMIPRTRLEGNSATMEGIPACDLK